MSRASTTFAVAIEDASALLQQFDAVHNDSQNTGEVLKRAGLVMALTAWETYVEDRIAEAVTARLKAVNGSPLGKFVSGKLAENSDGSTARRPRRHADWPWTTSRSTSPPAGSGRTTTLPVPARRSTT